MPILDIRATGIPDKGLDALAAAVLDLRPFWAELGADLARVSQERWPLRRQTGRLRKSLTWRGEKLGWGGIYEPTPDRLQFGINASLFYARFSQTGTKRQPRRELIHVEPERHREALASWLVSRAERAGLEVTP